MLKQSSFSHGKNILSVTGTELRSKKSPPITTLLISMTYLFNYTQSLNSGMHNSFEAYLPDILIARTVIFPNSLYVLSSLDRLSASDTQFCKL